LDAARAELTSEIGRLRAWHFWSGPLFTALGGVALMVASEFIPSIRPGILMALLVLFSIFSGGLASGLVSAAIATFAINFTYPPHSFLLSPANYGYMCWHISSLLVVLAVGERLRRSSYRARLADKLNRQLRFEIHNRSKIERQLREQNESFEDFVENGSIAMHWVGPDGMILWANQYELDFLGYTREEYIGHNIVEFHADQPVIEDILDRLNRDDTLHNYEARMRRKDGTIKYVHINSNVRRKDGEFIHTRCFTRDITEIKEKERRLLKDSLLFNMVAENLPAAIYTTDPAGVITFYNEKAVEAWGRQPVIGEDLWCGSWKIYHSDGSPCPLDQCPMAIALKERREIRGEEIIVERPDGSRLWIEPFPTPIFNENGEMTGALNLLLDIGDRKRAEEGQRRAEAEERRVSGELNQLSRISRILAESRNLEEASWELLRTACDLTDGYTAALWVEEEGSLRCADVTAIGDGCEDFTEITRNMVFKPGSGLPGRVLQSREPVFVYDIAADTNFPRKPYAERSGLSSAYAFPLRAGNRINGVLEVFFKGKREYQVEKLAGLAEAGTRIGIFIERQRAVEAMRDSENRFRALFQQAGVGVVQADIEGNIIAANDRYCEMIGHNPDELRGRKLIEFTHPEDRGKYIYQLGLLWAGDIDRLQIEKRNITSDGRTIWIGKTMSLVRDESGEAKYTVAVVQDVTPRIEAQQVVREQQDYLRAVLQSSPVCLAAVDTEGAYRIFSGTALEKLGVTAKDRLGKTIFEAQKDDPEVISWYQRALNGEAFVERQVIAGHTFELSFAPHRDEHGAVIGAIALATDISGRTRDEEALRASEERFRTLVYALPTAVYTTDAEGVITMYNEKAAELWGRRPEVGVDCFCGSYKAFSPDGKQLDIEDAPMAQTLKTGRPVQGKEILIERPDGSRVLVVPYPEPLLDSDGKLVGAVNVLVDITERKKAEKALLASESRLRTTLENAPLILTEISREGVIEFVIGRGLADAGAEPNTNVGKSIYETNKDTPDRIELF
ncbi:MAG TPA: PAS domain S-box protein, partial [Burkholderiales bacterium]|nr:PAS domain S-box protein [Burkholderiales bacterium]